LGVWCSSHPPEPHERLQTCHATTTTTTTFPTSWFGCSPLRPGLRPPPPPPQKYQTYGAVEFWRGHIRRVALTHNSRAGGGWGGKEQPAVRTHATRRKVAHNVFGCVDVRTHALHWRGNQTNQTARNSLHVACNYNDTLPTNKIIQTNNGNPPLTRLPLGDVVQRSDDGKPIDLHVTPSTSGAPHPVVQRLHNCHTLQLAMCPSHHPPLRASEGRDGRFHLDGNTHHICVLRGVSYVMCGAWVWVWDPPRREEQSFPPTAEGGGVGKEQRH
jgi:hypothetical protein